MFCHLIYGIRRPTLNRAFILAGMRTERQSMAAEDWCWLSRAVRWRRRYHLSPQIGNFHDYPRGRRSQLKLEPALDRSNGVWRRKR